MKLEQCDSPVLANEKECVKNDRKKEEEGVHAADEEAEIAIKGGKQTKINENN